MSMLGTNERDHAWMDEGLNSYFEFRYAAEKYRSTAIVVPLITPSMRKLSVADFQKQVYNALSSYPMPYAIETKSADFQRERDYSLTVDLKTAEWIYFLENTVGRNKVDNCFHHYFDAWKNKHPQPVDMKFAFEETLQGSLSSFFAFLNKEKSL